MPAHRTRLAFEPLSPLLDIREVVESTPNFEFAMNITCDSIDEFPLADFEKLVLFQVVLSGKPLVIRGFDKHLDKQIFSEKWLREKYAKKVEEVRDLVKKRTQNFSMGHYLENLPLLTRQITVHNYADKVVQRLYLKDIDCPPEWHAYLEKLLPPSLFYLNEAPKAFEGPASGKTNLAEIPRTPQGDLIAPAGDLMSSLPPNMRAENLMCYIGHEGTYTPAHQEMCASLGHNIMVDASDGSPEYGKPTEPGSSIWLMTETKDRRIVSEYWMSVLGHDIDIEDFFAPLHAWKIAPFKTWVVEQKPGDLILVPPLAAHQVWNRGTRTMKVAWNRTIVDTLELALREALPHARMVCRDEQYKNKAIVYFTLERYSKLLRQAKNIDHPVVIQLWDDFKRLFSMYKNILLSESFSQKNPEKNVEYHEFQSNVTCSFCRCNIFNRFLTCSGCAYALGGEEDPYDVCMDCYVMGRSCGCVSNLQWMEQFTWKHLTERYETWRRLIFSSDENNKDFKVQFPTFLVARGQAGKKSVAEICQEQLVRRPWNDPKKPNPVAKITKDADSEDENRSKKRRKLRQSLLAKSNDVGRCHVCLHFEVSWKLAPCSNCDQRYCYGSLFRAFEISPQEAMEKHHWLCPKCRKECSCAACQRDPSMKPYEPNCTILGHDTSKVADPRSIETLVDFRKSNLWWLKKFGDDVHGRIQKRQKEAEEAELERHKTLEDQGFSFESSPFDQPVPNGDGNDENEDDENLLVLYEDYGGIPVDPSLVIQDSVETVST
ncbi:hypothetical protein DTO013E5_4011 [Penicillium roqueforti]|uniref:uncharacterized protein n=1 Tax=Penicillium roqueforti TaxID=5082 RepID=UPI00190BF348|nr:uncharacterized protein LCP9604111_1558 [Penicillium roqueforti]KAF9251562.1 hypothetical protein LCP9604111_1558 [Penicillium roqueforti]KAI1836625.1 hypothetical protein CBS147337_2852 [Penicillium roqueforti]KAI2685237.1 hypothetical protein LCP963914a_4564 [Penicillium roqueforti]KAI2690420.1 hypothetical protein CBS147355_871 [Penicillium roqueforti]KAI2695609.1 hypothetical protein CBS147372_9026 [Penicillium roqueforti]